MNLPTLSQTNELTGYEKFFSLPAGGYHFPLSVDTPVLIIEGINSERRGVIVDIISEPGDPLEDATIRVQLRNSIKIIDYHVNQLLIDGFYVQKDVSSMSLSYDGHSDARLLSFVFIY